jgi:hypothetical protein
LPTQEAPPGAGGAGSIQGKVLSTMDVSNYTYVEMETASGVVWAAGPRTTVQIGDEVVVPAGAPMMDFYSPSLERRFDVIYFSPRIVVRGSEAPEAPEAPGGAPGGIPGAPGHPPTGGAALPTGGCPAPVAAASDLDVAGVEKLEGGATIAEILGGRDALSGQQVAVRGKVVKCNAGILGRTWLHLRDGTAGPDGAEDLTVTSDEGAPVGSTVVVRGTVALDRDFGYGYRYELLVEDASVSVE